MNNRDIIIKINRYTYTNIYSVHANHCVLSMLHINVKQVIRSTLAISNKVGLPW